MMLLYTVHVRNRAGQDRTGQGRTGQDRTGQDRAGQDRTDYDRKVLWTTIQACFMLFTCSFAHLFIDLEIYSL